MFCFQIYFCYMTRLVGLRFFSQIWCSMYILFSYVLFFWLMFCYEIFQHLYKYNKGNNFSFSLFLFFYHLLISIFDEMLDRYFLSQSFFITFMNKKQVTSSHLFSFFYHLLRSTFFSIIFEFDGYFSLRYTYFCSNIFFDKSFAFRYTFLCC